MMHSTIGRSWHMILLLLSVASGQTVRYTNIPPPTPLVSSAWWNNIVPTFKGYETRFDNKPGCLCADGVTPCNDWADQYAFLVANTTAGMTNYIIGVGFFGPKVVNNEYDRVILGPAGTNCPGTTPFRLLARDLDPVSWSWYVDSNDGHFCLTTASILNLTVDYTYLGGNRIEMDGLYNNNTVCFDPSYAPAANVSRLIAVQDASELKGLAQVAGTVSIPTVCGLIQDACPVGTGLQQFSSQQACQDYMATIPTEFGPCPESQAANTVNCRFLHALVAILPSVAPGEPLPATIHCPHTGTASVPCQDACLPACANCASNQHCKSTAVDPIVKQYQCVCNDGYITNTDGSCRQATCTRNSDCHSSVRGNIASCVSGQCTCAASFFWDITAGQCTCPAGNFVSYAASNSPQCVPIGRCYARYECDDQISGNEWNDVQCVQYGTNPFAPYQTCLCAPGFQGGFKYPCTCPSPGVVEWSTSINLNVCLQPGQCANNYDCPSGQTCVGSSSPPGTCA